MYRGGSEEPPFRKRGGHTEGAGTEPWRDGLERNRRRKKGLGERPAGVQEGEAEAAQGRPRAQKRKEKNIMKKKFKRIASLILAAVMVFAMAMPVMATEVEGDEIKGHTFKAYQIFAGSTSATPESTDETPDATIGNVVWGSAITDPVKFIKALKDDTTIKSAFEEISESSSAADVAKAIADAGWGEDSEEARALAKVAYANINKSVGVDTGTTIESGYYLVVDETEGVTGKDSIVNLALLQLTDKGPFTVKQKVDVPSVTKKVKETNDTTGNVTDWQDAADYDKTDTIEYQLRGTLPTGYASFDNYYYAFHDKLSSGLTGSTDNLKVYLVNGKKNGEYTEDDFKDLKTKVGKEDSNVTDITGAFTSKLENIDPSASEDGKWGSTLTVTCNDLKKSEFTESITEDSVIVVEYTAILNNEAVMGKDGNPNTVTLEYTNKPDAGGEGDKGTTPPDTVIVFTYELDVDKYEMKDEEKTALNGAGFTLYKLEANGEPKDKAEDGTKDENATAGPDGTGAWVKVGDEIFNAESAKFVWDRIDSGKYKLVETTVPDGYNKADDIIFTVKGVYDATGEEPALTDLTVVDDEGAEVEGFDVKLEAKTALAGVGIENKRGVTLPETGGIGTTIFYVVGSVLVLGAVILLVTKRRMKSE